MSILGRKMRRDLRRQGAQFAAVALTIGLGLAGFTAARDAYLDLNGSVDRVYGQLRFADLTITGGDATTITAAVDQLPGRPIMATRLQADIAMRTGSAKPLARLISLPADGTQPPVNRLDLVSGRLTTAGIAVEHHLAQHFSLIPGDSVSLATEAGWRDYPVSAVVTSPEYLWPARSAQEIATDPGQFGVVFAAEPVVRAVAARWTGSVTPTAATSAVALRVVDGADHAAVAARYAALPGVAATLNTRALQLSLADAFSLYNTLVVLMGLIGAVMAGALLYTTASANITERYVELSSLRAAGMSSGMLGRLATVENLLLIVGGIVPGIFSGWVLARYFMAAYENDQMRLSLQLRPLTLPVVAAVVLVVAGLAQLPALRGIRRTNLARVLRESST